MNQILTAMIVFIALAIVIALIATLEISTGGIVTILLILMEILIMLVN
jgi:hypothetical protein